MGQDEGDRYGEHERVHHLVSAIVTLGEIAKVWPGKEKRAVFLLCRECKLGNEGLVVRILSKVASSLGYR